MSKLPVELMQAIYALADTPRGPFIDTKPQRVAGEHQPGDNAMKSLTHKSCTYKIWMAGDVKKEPGPA